MEANPRDCISWQSNSYWPFRDKYSASDVAEYISGQKSSGQPELFQPELYKSKSSHLAEISRAPVQSWLPLATLLIDKENTVSKIKNYVKLIKQVVDSIPEFMLPTEETAPLNLWTLVWSI